MTCPVCTARHGALYVAAGVTWCRCAQCRTWWQPDEAPADAIPKPKIFIRHGRRVHGTPPENMESLGWAVWGSS